MTQQQVKSVERALSMHQDGLARAQRYSPEFQDKQLIADYEAQIAKLVNMLETGNLVLKYS